MPERKNHHSSLAVDAILRIEGNNNEDLLEKYLTQTNVDRIRIIAWATLLFMLLNLLDPKCWRHWYTTLGACIIVAASITYIIGIQINKKRGVSGTKLLYLSFWVMLMVGLFPFMLNDIASYEQPMNCLMLCSLMVIIPIFDKKEITCMFSVCLLFNEMAAFIGSADLYYHASVILLSVCAFFIGKNVQNGYIDTLREQENQKNTLLNIYESFPTGFMVIEYEREQGVRKIYLSEKVSSTLDYSGAELYGNAKDKLLAMIHIDERERFLEEIARCSKELGNINYDLRIANKTGGYHWLNLNASVAERNEDCHILIGVFTDIQQRKEAEIKADTMLRSIEGGFLVLEQNEEGKLQTKFLSDGFCRMLQIDETRREEFMRKSGVEAGVHPDDLEAVRKCYADALENRKGFKAAYRISGNEKNNYIWCGVNASVYENEQGRLVLYNTYTDINEQKI